MVAGSLKKKRKEKKKKKRHTITQNTIRLVRVKERPEEALMSDIAN